MMILDNVLKFHEMGIACIPLLPRDKKPCVSWEVYKTTLPTQAQIKHWFAFDQMGNYGVVAGWHNLAFLDFDEIDSYLNWWDWTQTHVTPGNLDKIKSMMQVATGRGVHVYFRIKNTLGLKNITLPAEMYGKTEVKIAGYVVGAGSTHPSGAVYTIMDNLFSFPEVENLSDIILLPKPTPPARKQLIKNPVPSGDTTINAWYSANNPGIDASGNDLIKNIRARIKIQDIIQARPSGNGFYMAICPLHDDHNPSMWIDARPGRDICNCNSCRIEKNMDVINLYARMKGVTEKQAIDDLAKLI